MIKLKQTFGGEIKVKFETELQLLNYEVSVLQRMSSSNFLKIQTDKGSSFGYCDSTKNTLSKKLQTNFSAEELVEIVNSLLTAVTELKKYNLDCEKILLNPEWIFWGTDNMWKFIFLPLNGCVLKYNLFSFLRELVYSAVKDAEILREWNKWISQLENADVFEYGIKKAKHDLELLKRKNSNYASRREQIEEAPTGLESSVYGRTRNEENLYDEDGEAPTGQDEKSRFCFKEEKVRISNEDDDGEARTTGDENNVYNFSSGNDGTYFYDSHSEAGKVITYSGASLTRLSNGEKVNILKDEFFIGRSQQKTDYCITDNKGISNVHAVIKKRGNLYFIKDNCSTNGTYVEGTKITSAQQEVQLKNNYTIKLWNEEFLFSISR